MEALSVWNEKHNFHQSFCHRRSQTKESNHPFTLFVQQMKNFTIRSAEYDKLFSAWKLRVRLTNMCIPCMSLVWAPAGTSSAYSFCRFVATMPEQKTPILQIKCQSLLVNINNETQTNHNTGDLVFQMLGRTCKHRTLRWTRKHWSVSKMQRTVEELLCVNNNSVKSQTYLLRQVVNFCSPVSLGCGLSTHWLFHVKRFNFFILIDSQMNLQSDQNAANAWTTSPDLSSHMMCCLLRSKWEDQDARPNINRFSYQSAERLYFNWAGWCICGCEKPYYGKQITNKIPTI
jgi:hypothetical protein